VGPASLGRKSERDTLYRQHPVRLCHPIQVKGSTPTTILPSSHLFTVVTFPSHALEERAITCVVATFRRPSVWAVDDVV